MIEPHFLDRAINALDCNPHVDVVVPQVAFFWEESEISTQEYRDYAIFLGESRDGAFLANRLSSATNLARRSALDRAPFNERMTSYEDWDLWARLSLAGARIAVDHAVGLWYRQRVGSMVAEARVTLSHAENLDRLRTHAERVVGALIPPYVLTTAEDNASGNTAGELQNQLRETSQRLAAAESRVVLLQKAAHDLNGLSRRKAVRYGVRLADLRKKFIPAAGEDRG